jgi:hypothetical protein
MVLSFPLAVTTLDPRPPPPPVLLVDDDAFGYREKGGVIAMTIPHVHCVQEKC